MISIAPIGANALLITVDAKYNSLNGGTGLDTGIAFTAGELFSFIADPDDLWRAGELPRWSNADGLIVDRYATGFDESGEVVGTLIGKDWGLYSQDGLSAPYGSIVGNIGSTFFLLGSSFTGPAPASGKLFVYYWDSNYGDNFGTVSAHIGGSEPQSVSESGTFILLTVGIAGLWFRKFVGRR